jgi:hypothetical protein
VRGDSHYWFPAKRYGWGWGLPNGWQGWAVLLAALAATAITAIWLLPRHPITFQLAALAVVGALVLICYAKGEPPSWRWGDPK